MGDGTANSRDTEQTLRMKAAMVMMSFERALAAYLRRRSVAQSPERTIASLAKRAGEQPRGLESAIESSYLGDLLDMVAECTKNTSESEPVRELLKLMDVLKIFDIRNAIAHPNRPFPAAYWYRLLVIATSSAVTTLRLEGVEVAVSLALAGSLEEPDEDWLDSIRWTLSNNLPDRFEHDDTGLVGRQREKKELLKLLRNRKLNLISVVAPGGIGKTALLLDCLHDITSSATDSDWVDQIVWFTAKTHSLTSTGIERLKPDVTLKDVRDCVLAEADEGTSGEEKRVLLALDNMETLLRDNPIEFSEFYQSLPYSWRVVVTSRVGVDSATTLPLKPLTKKGALSLAYAYLRCKGYTETVAVDELVEACGFNPLGIRISIDSYVAGASLADVLGKTKSEVLEYSYDVLVSSLSPLTKQVLEGLFVIGEPCSRAQISLLVDQHIDNVADSLGRLLRTTLIMRRPADSGELYNLNAGVYDLLLAQPADAEARRRLTARRSRVSGAAREAQRLQNERGASQLDQLYIPADLPAAVATEMSRVARLLRRQSTTRRQVAEGVSALKAITERGAQNPAVQRLLGVCLRNLGDMNGAISAFRDASQRDVAARMLLAQCLARTAGLAEALRLDSELMADGWGHPDKGGHLSVVLRRQVWTHRIWNGEAADVVRETKDWRQGEPEEMLTVGAMHAQACRRSVERTYREGNYQLIERRFVAATTTLDNLLTRFGVVGMLAVEGLKLTEQLAFAAGRGLSPATNSKAAFLNFTRSWLRELCSVHKSHQFQSETVQGWITSIGIWGTVVEREEGRKTPAYELSGGGNDATEWVFAEVYAIPRRIGRARQFMFARNGDTEYYVNRSVFIGTDAEWEGLAEGNALELHPGPVRKDKASPAVAARLPSAD